MFYKEMLEVGSGLTLRILIKKIAEIAILSLFSVGVMGAIFCVAGIVSAILNVFGFINYEMVRNFMMGCWGFCWDFRVFIVILLFVCRVYDDLPLP